jgi:DNA-binding transcriptional ArsR family regulator
VDHAALAEPGEAVSAKPAGALDAAFFALADSTRRAVIRELLREPLRAGELAERVRMSPPALTRHLRALRAAGLVVAERVEHDGRVSVYKLDFDTFASVRHWLEEIETHWQEQLAAFKEYAEGTHKSSSHREAREHRERRSR